MVEHRGAAPNGTNASKRPGSDVASRRVEAEDSGVSWHDAADASVPDTLLPDQYFDRLAVRACDTPEKRLMFAVLLDAVIQLQRRNSAGATEAEIWIRGEEGDDTPFSFPNVCEALGLDATYLSRGLLAWRGTHAAATRVPIRQLRTTHRRVTPVVGRRRRTATV
jgi:hypothetical protein